VAGFRHASPFVPILEPCRELALASFLPGRPVLEAALDLTRRIPKEFQYSPHSTSVTTPVAEVLRTRRGVCQDFAHLMLSSLRSLGLPARYVSGYLETAPPPGKARLVGADASHAWVQLWVPGSGWVDLDPTNGLAPRDRHIRLAVGRDFGDVSPLKGSAPGRRHPGGPGLGGRGAGDRGRRIAGGGSHRLRRDQLGKPLCALARGTKRANTWTAGSATPALSEAGASSVTDSR
jgi:transglutaminase-like putative cysteine protease